MDGNMKNQNGVVDSIYSGNDDEGATTVLTANPMLAGQQDDEGATTVLTANPMLAAKQNDEGATTVLSAPGVPGNGPQFGSAPGGAPQFGNAGGVKPQGMPPQGMAPQGMPPQGMPPQGMQPQGMPPQGMPPQGMQPGMGMPPQGMQPSMGMPPQGMQPGMGMPPQGMQPGMGMPPQGMPPQGAKPAKQKKAKQPKQGGKKNVGLIIGIVIAVLAAIGVGVYFLFFTPAKRLDRKMTAAREAVTAEKYEDAKTNFAAALKIDKENVEAMTGLIDAEDKLGETDQAKADADTYRETVKGLSAEKIESDKEFIQGFYVRITELNKDSVDKKIEILKEGLEVIPDDITIQQSLVGEYNNKASGLAALEKYEEIFDLYDKALAIDGSNAVAKAGKTDCAKSVLDAYMLSEQYDDAEAFIDKYDGKVDGVDFENYRDTIAKERELMAARHDVMEQTISLMSAGDFDGMMDVDGSENASIVVANMDGDSYIYAQDGFTSDYTGKAAGIYRVDGDGYLFYYGDYVDGVRSGNGTQFIKLDGYQGTYQVYEGAWANDAPNGAGVMWTKNEANGGSKVSRKWTGNFKDGLVDGDIELTLTDEDGSEYKGTFTASSGEAPDIRDQYPDYNFGDVSENQIVYAVLEDETGSSLGWWVSRKADYKIGVYGFTD